MIIEGITEKVVAITGASSGIGKAAAMELARNGAKVVLGAQGKEKLEQLAEQIRGEGGEAAVMSIDVSRKEQVASLVELACHQFGRLDVMISNAGVMPIGPLDDLAVDDWEKMVDVNIKGVLWGVAAALPVFRRQSSGHFIHTASTSARKTVPNQAVYSGTKAAVVSITDGLRQELAGAIRVTLITPGMTDTGFADHITNDALKSQISETRGKVAMSPAAVASAIVYAISQPDDVNVGEIVVRSTSQP